MRPGTLSILTASAALTTVTITGCSSASDFADTASDSAREAATTSAAVLRQVPSPPTAAPEYTVIAERLNRYDGEPNYYAVIGPVDTNTDAFQADVKQVLQALAHQHGSLDFSASVFDDEAVAQEAFDEQENLEIGDDSSRQRREQHLIAMYSGGLDTTGYPYLISWYPAAFTGSPNVGQWVDTEQWRPETTQQSAAPTTTVENSHDSMAGNGTHSMGGIDGKDWGSWESDGARSGTCTWSVRFVSPNAPAEVLDEGESPAGQSARVNIQPIGDVSSISGEISGGRMVFMTSNCEPWRLSR